MYCILITGIPAAGKSTLADFLSAKLRLPVVSKDRIKELLFDGIGFRSREEKNKLGKSAAEIMFYFAEQQMKLGLPFLLENNFENASREGMLALLEKYSYTALTVTLTGDYRIIYKRFVERNASPDRHRGHVVNDRYPENRERTAEECRAVSISYEDYLYGIRERGMDTFQAGGGQLVIDTTDFQRVDFEAVSREIEAWIADRSA